jgi:feruloyl esterase
LHTITVLGKDLTKSFYGKPHSKSYFLGCSQGGRQGIGAAEKFPEDFDGIVAGAPALDFNNLISWRASFYPLTGGASSPSFIKPEVWSGPIHDEILRQCDSLDGVSDGIIEYPDLCNFDPTPLQCQGGVSSNCLTAQQIEVVRKVFQPLTYSDGSLIYPGMQCGSEKKAIDRLYAGKPFSDSQDWFRYVIYSNFYWDASTFNVDRDAKASEDLNPFNIKTFPSNLNTFQSQGGKIITYHGMQDQQITGHNTNRWFDHLLEGATASDLDEYIRYFRISGMFHCNSGPGAWMIGQGSSSLPFDREHNVLAAIIDWVEQGVAPETIEGTKYNNDVEALGVAYTRRHCRYDN